MTNKTINNTRIKKRLIAAMVKKLLSEQYKVSANHIGFPNGIPDKISGFIPDILAKKGREVIIYEAVTIDTLQDTNTKIRWTAYTNDKNIKFGIITPYNIAVKVKQLRDKWNMDITQFWTLKI